MVEKMIVWGVLSLEMLMGQVKRTRLAVGVFLCLKLGEKIRLGMVVVHRFDPFQSLCSVNFCYT